jgi:hypothetical protein
VFWILIPFYFISLFDRGVVIQPHYDSHLSVRIKLGGYSGLSVATNVASEKILLDTTEIDQSYSYFLFAKDPYEPVF